MEFNQITDTISRTDIQRNIGQKKGVWYIVKMNRCANRSFCDNAKLIEVVKFMKCKPMHTYFLLTY